ncbi:MAG: pentapeptide repeat-containing protein, partial [Rhodospirillaceae bacterium]|nr:pentapeptide repeat-containing protein [Rhodospirillaceae bacterium]MBT6117834.1 pentapeptide repeat-containing protein [Rhodospirillaceae bacterium]
MALPQTHFPGPRAAHALAGALVAVLLLVAGPVLADCTDFPAPGVDWKRCRMDRRDLTEVDLSGAHLRDTSFMRANLSGSVLSGADAFRAKFISTVLVGAILDGARLAEADMTKADLTGASLKGANLQRAKLFRAILRGADLTGAEMRGADFLNADLSGALWVDGSQVCAEGSVGRCKAAK